MRLYHEKQMGYSLIFILAMAIWMVCYMGRITDVLIPVVVLLFVAALFYRMTIDVVDGEVRVVYGIGLIRKVVKVDRIEGMELMATPGWWVGAGIRFYGRGWLYSINFTSAIELTLTDRRMRVAIGTNNPQALGDAIVRAREGKM